MGVPAAGGVQLFEHHHGLHPQIGAQQPDGGDGAGHLRPRHAARRAAAGGATYLFNPFITVFADSYARRDKKGFFKAVFAVQGIVLALLPLGLAVAHFLGRWGLATFVSPGLADYQYLLGPMVVSAILTALVLFYSMVLTVMRCMKGLIVANVCAIAVSALASGPCIARWGAAKAPPMQPFWPSWCSW